MGEPGYHAVAGNRDSNGHDCLGCICVKQGQERLVVPSSDAIVQKQTMVVEFLYTAVAFAAVLRRVIHPLIAYRALVDSYLRLCVLRMMHG